MTHLNQSTYDIPHRKGESHAEKYFTLIYQRMPTYNMA